MKQKTLDQEVQEFADWMDQQIAEEAEKRKPKAKVYEFPDKLSEQELIRRQRVIDATWERVLAERQELEKEAARSCHRGPQDSDWDIRTPDYWGRK